jgi:UPF0716 protein FxsA
MACSEFRIDFGELGRAAEFGLRILKSTGPKAPSAIVDSQNARVNGSFDPAARPRYHARGMFGYLFLLFTIVPLVELALLIWIGGETEWWVPVLMVLVSGIAGAALARWQGWRALERIRDDLRQGRVPTDALVDGVLILVAGLLLITPGVLTDALGFALLVPPLRRAIKRGVVAWFRRNVEIRAAHFTAGRDSEAWRSPNRPDATGRTEIIDARVIDTRVEDSV